MTTVAFDTLAFSQRLQEAGVPTEQADAQARAQADFLAQHLFAKMATKDDIRKLQDQIEEMRAAWLDARKEDLQRSATKEDLQRFATKEDLQRFATKEDLQGFATKEDLQRFATKDELALMAKTLTIRLGAMLAVWAGMIATLTQL